MGHPICAHPKKSLIRTFKKRVKPNINPNYNICFDVGDWESLKRYEHNCKYLASYECQFKKKKKASCEC